MAKKFPQDEFDFATRQGGSHRGAVRVSDRVFGFAKYLLSVTVLSAAGILALNLFSQSTEVAGPIDVAPTTSVQTETFKGDGLGVTVIDSTNAKGLAAKVAKALLDDGWNVYGAADAGLASGAVSIGKTTVFYNSDLAKDAANTLLQKLGKFELKKSSFYADPITVVLAKDYQ